MFAKTKFAKFHARVILVFIFLQNLDYELI